MTLPIVGRLRSRARELTREIRALYLAARDPRTPWLVKVFAALLVAYALSPIDLIPDFIPVLGYVDDLLLLPLGIVLLLKLIPPEVMADCRTKAAASKETLPRNWSAAAMIVIIWLLAVFLMGRLLMHGYWGDENWDARFGY